MGARARMTVYVTFLVCVCLYVLWWVQDSETCFISSSSCQQQLSPLDTQDPGRHSRHQHVLLQVLARSSVHHHNTQKMVPRDRDLDVRLADTSDMRG